MTLSKPSYLPKAPPPKSITLEIEVSTYGFVGHKHSDCNSLPRQEHFVLVFCGCYNKLPSTEWLKATEMIISQFWWPQVQNQGVGRAAVPLEAPGRMLPCLFWLPVAPGVPWLASASLQSLPPSSYHLLLCVSPICVSCKDTCHWIRTHPDNPGWSHLMIFNYICKEPFSEGDNIPRFQGFDMDVSYGGGHHSTHYTNLPHWLLLLSCRDGSEPSLLKATLQLCALVLLCVSALTRYGSPVRGGCGDAHFTLFHRMTNMMAFGGSWAFIP